MDEGNDEYLPILNLPRIHILKLDSYPISKHLQRAIPAFTDFDTDTRYSAIPASSSTVLTDTVQNTKYLNFWQAQF